MALYRSPDYQTSFESIGFSVQEKKLNIDFQDGGHLGFPIRTILAAFLSTSHLDTSKTEVLNPVAFLLRRKVQNRFSTWLLGRPSWICNQNDFSYF